MNFIHNLERRKQNTKFIVEEASEFFTLMVNNRKLAGIILATFHIIVICMSMLYLFFTTKIDYIFYICFIFWILIVSMHLYFNGCIIIRIERELMNDKHWCAGWTPLFSVAENFYFKRKISKEFANNFFICIGILISAIIFLKFLYYY